jgi:hypothetical protein
LLSPWIVAGQLLAAQAALLDQLSGPRRDHPVSEEIPPPAQGRPLSRGARARLAPARGGE